MSRQQKMRPAFYDLHAMTLNPDATPDAMAHALRRADAVADRHRLSEGAVYSTALRRYTMMTGLDWRGSQQPIDAASWGESDHRLRFREEPGNQWIRWACSCGATAVCDDRATGTAAHAAHLTALVPA